MACAGPSVPVCWLSLPSCWVYCLTSPGPGAVGAQPGLPWFRGSALALVTALFFYVTKLYEEFRVRQWDKGSPGHSATPPSHSEAQDLGRGGR